MIAKIFTKGSNQVFSNTKETGSHKAVEILKERFASGEISEDEYNNKINKLKE
jgi:putative membrane protein